MTTVLQYLVIAAAIGAVVFVGAVFVFGRGEQMAALPPRTSPTELPERNMTGQDVRSVRFAMSLRGYRMSDVDWALERLAGQLDLLREELAQRDTGGQASTAQPARPDDLAQRRAQSAEPASDAGTDATVPAGPVATRADAFATEDSDTAPHPPPGAGQ